MRPEQLTIERVDEVVEHHPDACRRCGHLLDGFDPDPLRHQVIEIPLITPLVIEIPLITPLVIEIACIAWCAPAVPPAPVQRCRLMWKRVTTAQCSVP